MQENESILLPLAYLGPVTYFARVLQADHVEVELNENYVKQTYRNRCRIATANGPLDLIIPVRKVNGNHTLVRDVEIVYAQKWQLNHWRAIESAYSKAPFFLYYREEFEPFYRKQFKLLSEFNSKLLLLLLELIGVNKEVHFTTKYQGGSNLAGLTDLRTAFDPKITPENNLPLYYQVFSERQEHHPDLSIIDLLFNTGPDANEYLEKLHF